MLPAFASFDEFAARIPGGVSDAGIRHEIDPARVGGQVLEGFGADDRAEEHDEDRPGKPRFPWRRARSILDQVSPMPPTMRSEVSCGHLPVRRW